MSSTLAATAFLMGLVGGPHCLAMCGAACGALTRGGGGDARVPGMWTFQGGRLLGYTLAGGVAGGAAQALAWLAAHGAALRPLWTAYHAVVLLWGLVLLAHARQPAWMEAAGRGVWGRVRPLARRPGGLVTTGALWAFMPCGLLYSALLVASLAGGIAAGAACMALFAIGSGITLGLAPAAFRRLQALGNGVRRDWGTRAAGLLLAGSAVFALFTDFFHRVAAWCGLS